MKFKKNQSSISYKEYGIDISIDDDVNSSLVDKSTIECTGIFPNTNEIEKAMYINSLFLTVISETGQQSMNNCLLYKKHVFSDDYTYEKLDDGSNAVVVCFDFILGQEIIMSLDPGTYYIHISSLQYQSNICKFNIL